MDGSESNQVSKPLPAPNGMMLSRLASIGLVVAVIAGLFLYAGGWFTPHALTPATMIHTFEHVDGVHPGFRRNHAKGVCVTGYFDSNGQGQSLSKAQVFESGRVPVIGRFALAGGQPYAADTPQTVRSLALLLKSRDGEEWRTAMTEHSRFSGEHAASVPRFPGTPFPTRKPGKWMERRSALSSASILKQRRR